LSPVSAKLLFHKKLEGQGKIRKPTSKRRSTTMPSTTSSVFGMYWDPKTLYQLTSILESNKDWNKCPVVAQGLPHLEIPSRIKFFYIQMTAIVHMKLYRSGIIAIYYCLETTQAKWFVDTSSNLPCHKMDRRQDTRFCDPSTQYLLGFLNWSLPTFVMVILSPSCKHESTPPTKSPVDHMNQTWNFKQIWCQ